MGDRPMIFSAPMVKALLAGTKAQTRRMLKPQPEMQPNGFWHVSFGGGGVVNVRQQDIGDTARDYVPWYEGQRLWVKEAWRSQEAFDDLSPVEIGAKFEAEHGEPWCPVFYEADRKCGDGSVDIWQQSGLGRQRASINMPRWASRLTLLVTDVRVQRLQDISEEDAICREDFRKLWNNIHGPDAWDANPWICAISFDVVAKNIDQITPAASVDLNIARDAGLKAAGG